MATFEEAQLDYDNRLPDDDIPDDYKYPDDDYDDWEDDDDYCDDWDEEEDEE